MSDNAVPESADLQVETKKRFRLPKFQKPTKKTIKLVAATAVATTVGVLAVQNRTKKTLSFDVSTAEVVDSDDSSED